MSSFFHSLASFPLIMPVSFPSSSSFDTYRHETESKRLAAMELSASAASNNDADTQTLG